jgi:hypothetical protein
MATALYFGLTPNVQRCRSNYEIRKKKKLVGYDRNASGEANRAQTKRRFPSES